MLSTLEDVAAFAAQTKSVVTIHFPGHSLLNVKAAEFHGDTGLLVCTGDETHYVRLSTVSALSLRKASEEPEHPHAALREELRHAVGYPLSLHVRVDLPPEELTQWVGAIATALAGVCELEPVREQFQATVDQILLRAGEATVRLGGSTLFFEHNGKARTAEEIKRAVEVLL
ncbi:MAG: hypothetical protein FJW30_23730 [Acidobacteria bacterium]|nr:hypothetical protein [Acidobacteriota bacterium]